MTFRPSATASNKLKAQKKLKAQPIYSTDARLSIRATTASRTEEPLLLATFQSSLQKSQRLFTVGS